MNINIVDISIQIVFFQSSWEKSFPSYAKIRVIFVPEFNTGGIHFLTRHHPHFNILPAKYFIRRSTCHPHHFFTPASVVKNDYKKYRWHNPALK